VRLAAQLTSWRIDIRSETQWAENPEPILTAAAPVAGAAAAPEPVESGERVRIYELARQLEVESKDLVEIMQEEGIDVTSHASSISAQQARMVRELLLGGEGSLEDFDADELSFGEDETEVGAAAPAEGDGDDEVTFVDDEG